MKRCSRGVRHWFTRRGLVGIPTRTCVRCGEPNPYLADRLEAIGWDMAELEASERASAGYPREES